MAKGCLLTWEYERWSAGLAGSVAEQGHSSNVYSERAITHLKGHEWDWYGITNMFLPHLPHCHFRKKPQQVNTAKFLTEVKQYSLKYEETVENRNGLEQVTPEWLNILLKQELWQKRQIKIWLNHEFQLTDSLRVGFTWPLCKINRDCPYSLTFQSEAFSYTDLFTVRLFVPRVERCQILVLAFFSLQLI